MLYAAGSFSNAALTSLRKKSIIDWRVSCAPSGSSTIGVSICNRQSAQTLVPVYFVKMDPHMRQWPKGPVASIALSLLFREFPQFRREVPFSRVWKED